MKKMMSSRWSLRSAFITRTASLFLAVLLLLSLSAGIAPGAQAVEVSEESEECSSPVTVKTACQGVSETHSGVTYEHCVASLGANPRSKEEEADNMHGLAVLATKLAIDHAASTESKIDELAELEDSPHARSRFNHCLEQYGGAADLLRDSLDNLKAKIYGKAMEQLVAVLGASK